MTSPGLREGALSTPAEPDVLGLFKCAIATLHGYSRHASQSRRTGEDLHKRLRLAAVEQDCTATDIIERLMVKELNLQ